MAWLDLVCCLVVVSSAVTMLDLARLVLPGSIVALSGVSLLVGSMLWACLGISLLAILVASVD